MSESWNEFDRTTSRWGPITMTTAMVVMVAGPAVLAAQVGIDPGAAVVGFAAIALAFGFAWVFEPVSYFPLLGPASMYQAFMIGNISNKLLPAAVVAQSRIGADPGTRRGQLAAVLAICGAACTHLLSLAVCVGLLGALLRRLIPESFVETVQTYVIPAILGAILVQLVASTKAWRTLGIALVLAAIVQFLLIPISPVFLAVGFILCIVGTVAAELVLHRTHRDSTPERTAP